MYIDAYKYNLIFLPKSIKIFPQNILRAPTSFLLLIFWPSALILKVNCFTLAFPLLHVIFFPIAFIFPLPLPNLLHPQYKLYTPLCFNNSVNDWRICKPRLICLNSFKLSSFCTYYKDNQERCLETFYYFCTGWICGFIYRISGLTVEQMCEPRINTFFCRTF